MAKKTAIKIYLIRGGQHNVIPFSSEEAIPGFLRLLKYDGLILSDIINMIMIIINIHGYPYAIRECLAAAPD